MLNRRLVDNYLTENCILSRPFFFKNCAENTAMSNKVGAFDINFSMRSLWDEDFSMGYSKSGRICRNPHKGMRSELSARALYNSHRTCFSEYVPPERLTANQQALLEGAHPNPRKGDVTKLIKKLEYHERFDDAANVYNMYAYFFTEAFDGDPTPDEAIVILEGLTPGNLKK